ncbi:MAG: GTP pyrophosphokinase [Dermatophilaceae bacterium]
MTSPAPQPEPDPEQAAPSDWASVSDPSAAIARYAVLHPELGPVTTRFVSLIRGILDEAGINYLTVTGRAKSVESFAAKATRERDGQPVHREPLREITDQVGVRVITYVQSDVVAVAELLADEFTVLEDRDMGQETAREGRFGYSSRHVLVSLDGSAVEQTLESASPTTEPAASGGAAPAYSPLRCASVQLRTVLQHAWAEFEHDIRYKGTVPPEHVPDLERRFTLAAGLLELADREFSTIRDKLQAGMGDETAAHPDETDPRISAQELATFLAGRYASAGWSRTEHYTWISGLLLELGIVSLDELSDVLRPIDTGSVTARMGYRYPAGAVRRLDDDLLARFGERYAGLLGNDHRREALLGRLAKLTALPGVDAHDPVI